MRYRYVTVFHIEGLLPPANAGEILLISDPSAGEKIILTGNIKMYSAVIDRGRALGVGMLKSLVGKGKKGQFEDELHEDILRIERRRQDRFGGGPFLVLEFSGQTEVDLSGPSADLSDFSVVFDAVDKAELRGRHQPRIEMALTSLGLVLGPDLQAERVTSGLYLIGQDRVLHSFTFTDSAALRVSRALDKDSIQDVVDYLELASQCTDLSRVYRLLTQAMTGAADKLRAFLASWTALEVLVNKLFKTYEKTFMKAHIESTPLTEEFFGRVKRVMSGKYRIRDKFIAVSSVLARDPSEAEQDLATFVCAKEMRDDFIHGEDIDESILPSEEVLSLAKKYLRLHLDTTDI